MRRPRVSILVPNLDHGEFLRQSLDSVLDQGYPDLEVFVLDGGSRDGSLGILEGYGDAISWRSAPDAGQAAALNEGLRKATGEIVAWLNSDDYHLPGAIETAVEALERSPDAVAVHAAAWIVDASGRRLRRYPGFDFRRRDLSRKCYVCQPTVFLRREALALYGLLNEDLDVCFDYEWWLRMTRSARMAWCPRPLAASRRHARTKTLARRSRGLVEAGYLMRHHFGGASWRWAAKWAVHRWQVSGRPSPLRPRTLGRMGLAALAYRRRFGPGCGAPSRQGRRLLDSLASHERRPGPRPASVAEEPDAVTRVQDEMA